MYPILEETITSKYLLKQHVYGAEMDGDEESNGFSYNNRNAEEFYNENKPPPFDSEMLLNNTFITIVATMKKPPLQTNQKSKKLQHTTTKDNISPTNQFPIERRPITLNDYITKKVNKKPKPKAAKRKNKSIKQTLTINESKTGDNYVKSEKDSILLKNYFDCLKDDISDTSSNESIESIQSLDIQLMPKQKKRNITRDASPNEFYETIHSEYNQEQKKPNIAKNKVATTQMISQQDCKSIDIEMVNLFRIFNYLEIYFKRKLEFSSEILSCYLNDQQNLNYFEMEIKFDANFEKQYEYFYSNFFKAMQVNNWKSVTRSTHMFFNTIHQGDVSWMYFQNPAKEHVILKHKKPIIKDYNFNFPTLFKIKKEESCFEKWLMDLGLWAKFKDCQGKKMVDFTIKVLPNIDGKLKVEEMKKKIENALLYEPVQEQKSEIPICLNKEESQYQPSDCENILPVFDKSLIIASLISLFFYILGQIIYVN